MKMTKMRSLKVVLIPLLCCLFYLAQGFQLPSKIQATTASRLVRLGRTSRHVLYSEQSSNEEANSNKPNAAGPVGSAPPSNNRDGNPLVDEMVSLMMKSMDPKMFTSFMFPGDESKRNTYLGKVVGDVFMSSFIGNSEDTSSFEASSTSLHAAAPSSTAEPSIGKQYAAVVGEKPKKKKLPLAFLNIESIGLGGGWQEKDGNFFLFPPSTVAPKAIIHFLGGSFVGAAPHLSYKYMLESLSEKGFIIVATPYRLELDYLKVCDGIIQKFDPLRRFLLKELDVKLPIIGMGHSGGALLHTFLSALFPDYSYKSANILISFNNRPASHAIPAFHELIVPLSKQIINEKRFNQTASSFNFMRKYISTAVDLYSDSYISPTFFSDEILPLFRQGMEIVDQVPPLMQVIASGKEEFSPAPQHAKEVIRLMYRIPHTLLVQFKADSLDESDAIEKIFGEANTIMRMKLNRTMEQMDVKKFVLDGSHNTPLTQNLLVDVNQIAPTVKVPETYNRLRSQFQHSYIDTVNDVNNAISKYLTTLLETEPNLLLAHEVISDYKPREVSLPDDILGESKSAEVESSPFLPASSEGPISLNPADDNKRKMLFVKSRIVRKPDATSTVSQTSTGVLQIPQTSRTQQAIIVLRNFVQAAAFNTIRAAQIIKAYFARLVAGSKEIAQTPTMQIATEKGRVFVAELAVVVKAFLVLMYSNISKFARATPSFVTPLLIRLKHKLATVDWLAQIFNVVQHSIIVAYLYLTPF